MCCSFEAKTNNQQIESWKMEYGRRRHLLKVRISAQNPIQPKSVDAAAKFHAGSELKPILLEFQSFEIVPSQNTVKVVTNQR